MRSSTQTFENFVENSLCLRVPNEAGGGPPQARYRPGDHHYLLRHCHTVHLGPLMTMIQVNTDVLDTVLLSLHPAEVSKKIEKLHIMVAD